MVKRLLCLFILLGSLAGLPSLLRPEEKPLASPKLIQALVQEVSGEIAFRYMQRITEFDRIQASEGWHEAALYIKAEMERNGIVGAELEGWPSNGTRRYYTYRAPIGWKAKSSELWLVSPRRERLCSFEEMPLTLVKHSGPADVEAELVDVKTGNNDGDYKNKEVKGRIVLATGNPAAVMRKAVLERGALGVILWYPPEVRPGYPSMVRYTAFWPVWEERERIGFGFNVSKMQGWALKKMLEEGQKVVLKAKVDAEYFETRVEVLTAAFPGTAEPEREVLIIGHLCHPSPSANDNASGSGGMLEMARALQRLIRDGFLPAPRRTIRFLWVPEFNGTVPYIQVHLDRTRRTLAALNCDMIGEDLHKTGGQFNITRTPDSRPSFLTDVAANFARLAESLNLRSPNGSDHPFAWRVVPFGGGSDHYLFNDGALRVPALMFGHGDIFHHTSLDTTDKVDPSELRRVCFLTLGTVYYLAQAADGEAVDMARLTVRNGLGRLAANYYDSCEGMRRASGAENLWDSYRHTRNIIACAAEREERAVLSATEVASSPAGRAEVAAVPSSLRGLALLFQSEADKMYRNLCRARNIAPVTFGLTPAERELDRVIPLRAEDFVCPLQTDYLVEKLGEEAVRSLKLSGNAAYEALNFADGRRSVTGISRAVSVEFGPVDVREVYRYFQALEKAGLVSLKTKGR